MYITCSFRGNDSSSMLQRAYSAVAYKYRWYTIEELFISLPFYILKLITAPLTRFTFVTSSDGFTFLFFSLSSIASQSTKSKSISRYKPGERICRLHFCTYYFTYRYNELYWIRYTVVIYNSNNNQRHFRE